MANVWTPEKVECGICGKIHEGELPENWNLSAMHQGQLVAPVCDAHQAQEGADGELHII